MEESLKIMSTSINHTQNLIPTFSDTNLKPFYLQNPSEGFDLEDEEIKNKIIDL